MPILWRVKSKLQRPICTLAPSLPPKISCEHFVSSDSKVRKWPQHYQSHTTEKRWMQKWTFESLVPCTINFLVHSLNLYILSTVTTTPISARHFLSENTDIPHFFYIKPSWLKKKYLSKVVPFSAVLSLSLTLAIFKMKQ